MIDNKMQQATTSDKVAAQSTNKAKLDLVILQYMAQQLYITLQQPDPRDPTTEPLLYALKDCQQRTQRIALYKPQELLLPGALSFVGFVSGKKRTISPFILDEIERIDELMVAELINIPGMLSYSSLEIRPGRWYNLVVFHNPETKTHLKNSHTHAYAVHRLAPHYYEWIRLHNGIMPDGLAQQKLFLQTTKYYTFLEGQQRPNMYEVKNIG